MDLLVSYQSPKHIYLKWQGISAVPDSLQVNGTWLRVLATSSQSVVLVNNGLTVTTGSTVSVTLSPNALPPIKNEIGELVEIQNEPVAVERDVEKTSVRPSALNNHSVVGRFGVDVFSTVNSSSSMTRIAERFSLDAKSTLGKTVFDLSSSGISRHYVNQSVTTQRWNVYELVLQSRGTRSEISVGRSIPRFAASLGPIDGISATVNLPLRIHALVGFQPDYQTFGFSSDTRFFGLFASTPKPLGKAEFSAALGWVTVSGLNSIGERGIDRKLWYQQISLQIRPNISIYTALELDTYQRIEGQQPNSQLSPTGIYTSLNWGVSSRLNLFFSFDNRAPRIFYQQFDAELEQLMFNLGMQQGYRIRATQKLSNRWMLGSSGTFRVYQSKLGAFGMGELFVKYRPWFTKSGSIEFRVVHSLNAVLNTTSGQLQYYGSIRGKGSYRLYTRYLRYDYPGSAPAVSDRIYLGAQLAKDLHGLSSFVRLEGSYRAQIFYPSINLGLTYHLSKKL